MQSPVTTTPESRGVSGADRDSPSARRDGAIFAAIVAVFLCITLPLSAALNIWIDESYSLLTTSRDLAFVFQHSRDFETQPPMYYVLLWIWRHFGDSIFFARMSSVTIGVAAVWFIGLAAKRWIPGAAPGWVSATLAINTYFIWATTEIRTYALVILLTAVLSVLFHDGFYQEQPRRLLQAIYAIVALIAISAYYYLGFFLVAPAAVLLVERRWRVLAQYVGWMALVGLVFLPGFILGGEHMGIVSHALKDPPTPLRALQMVLGRLFSMPFAFTYLPIPVKWIAMGVSLCVAVASLWVFRANITPRVRALWIIAGTVAFCYLGVVQFVFGEHVLNRHFLVLLVPSTLALYSITSIYGRHAKTARVVWLTIALAFNAFEAFNQFKPLAKVGDYRRVAQYIEAHEQAGQSIVIVANHAELPFSYYYRGTSRIVPLPEKDDYLNYVFEEWQLESVEQVREQLAGAVSTDGLLWVFMDRPPDSVFFGVDLHFEYLESAIAADFTVLDEQEFYFGNLRLLGATGVEREVSSLSAEPGAAD